MAGKSQKRMKVWIGKTSDYGNQISMNGYSHSPAHSDKASQPSTFVARTWVPHHKLNSSLNQFFKCCFSVARWFLQQGERLTEEFVSNRPASRTRSIWIRGDSTSSSTNDTSAHTRCDQKDEQNVVWPSSRHDVWKTCSDSESLSISGRSGIRDNERICLEVIASGKKMVDVLLSRQGLCSTFLDFEEDAYIEAERGTIFQGICDQFYWGTDTHLSSACPMWVYMFGWKCKFCCVVKRSKTVDKHYHFVAHEVPMVYGLIICRLESWFQDHFVDKGLHALQNGPG